MTRSKMNLVHMNWERLPSQSSCVCGGKGDMMGVQGLRHKHPILPNASWKSGMQDGQLCYLWCCRREGEQN